MIYCLHTRTSDCKSFMETILSYSPPLPHSEDRCFFITAVLFDLDRIGHEFQEAHMTHQHSIMSTRIIFENSCRHTGPNSSPASWPEPNLSIRWNASIFTIPHIHFPVRSGPSHRSHWTLLTPLFLSFQSNPSRYFSPNERHAMNSRVTAGTTIDPYIALVYLKSDKGPSAYLHTTSNYLLYYPRH